jgi:hypothetical protein
MQQDSRSSDDLTRIMLAVQFIGALIVSTAWIMRISVSVSVGHHDRDFDVATAAHASAPDVPFERTFCR